MKSMVHHSEILCVYWLYFYDENLQRGEEKIEFFMRIKIEKAKKKVDRMSELNESDEKLRFECSTSSLFSSYFYTLLFMFHAENEHLLNVLQFTMNTRRSKEEFWVKVEIIFS
jgi:hypothetical protein